ncbi:MAG: transaldolase family protein, partial [Pseudanabaena sp.]
YYKKFGYKTEIMGASFRNKEEIIELAGCDLLTISPALLDELHHIEGELVRKLGPEIAAQSDIEKITIDQATFAALHKGDRMAFEKLDEGIKGFSKALVTLEELLTARLAKLEG